MPITADTLRRYQNKVFCETGCFLGDGVKAALLAGFPIIHSIELDAHLALDASIRFATTRNVRIHVGNSANVLPNLLTIIDCPATFFLDAHYSGEGTAKGENEPPLMEELEAIAKHRIKTHKILIDDMRGLEGLEKAIEMLLLAENGAYRFERIDGFVKGDILAATCPG